MKSYFKVFIIGLKYIRQWIDKTKETYIYAAIFFAFNYLLISIYLIEKKDLDQRTSYALGVITKFKYGKNEHAIYEFYVGDKTYIRSEGFSRMSKIRVGDSIIVAYEYTNPHNNEIYCYFEYRLDRSKLPDSVFYRQAIDSQRRPLK